MREHFFSLADGLQRALRKDEVLLCNFSGERSDFVRFNHGKVRQAGTVEQRYLSLRLVRGRRQASASMSLAGSHLDLDSTKTTLVKIRESLEQIPDDPWLLINEKPCSTSTERRGALLPAEEVVRQTAEAAQGRDLVGFYASGTIYRGFANSLGQRNWHEAESFNFDWSLYRQTDQAVKSGYAGFEWDTKLFIRKLATSSENLKLLGAERKEVKPGEYRVFLAPKAMEDLMQLLSWGGFSARARETKQSPLLRVQNGQPLAPKLSLAENIDGGVAAAFQEDGFVKPPRVPLIERGKLGEALVSPRSAKEYGLPANAANGSEMPEALDLAGGSLEEGDVAAALDTGLYINNLWYLNYSDRPAGRITGMTRFATFWVEGGRIVAPVGPMRFDDSILRMLGENLVDLTVERELLLDPGTYGERSTSSARLPGALLSALRLTL